MWLEKLGKKCISSGHVMAFIPHGNISRHQYVPLNKSI